MAFSIIRLGISDRWILSCVTVASLICMPGIVSAADLHERLLKAAKKGDAKKVSALLSEGADVNAADAFGWTPLKRAAENNKVEVVNLLIDRGADIDAQHGERNGNLLGAGALHLAAEKGLTEAVKALIARGATLDLTVYDLEGPGFSMHYTTALGVAFQRGKKGTVELLLEAGADPFYLLETSKWAKAEENNDTESYQEIAAKYPNSFIATEANRRLANSEYAFFHTARIGTKDAVRGFIKSHPSSDRVPIATDFLDYLEKAQHKDIVAVTEFIRSSPANPFARVAEADYPVLYMRYGKARPCIERIEVVGARPKKAESRREYASLTLTEQLESVGIEPTLERDETTTHLIEVVASGAISVEEAQAQAALSLSAGATAMAAGGMLAYGSRNPVITSMLFSSLGRGYSPYPITGEPIAYSDIEQLHVTVRRASDGEVLYLDEPSLASSGYYRVRNYPALLRDAASQVKLAASMVTVSTYSRGHVAGVLYNLTMNNDIDSVKALLASAPETNVNRGIGTLQGLTPLMAAASNGSIELASYLIDKGATLSARTASGETALMMAAATQNVPMVSLLLQSGAEADVADAAGVTPLLVVTGDVVLVRLLLENGGNINHQSDRGATALQIAAGNGYAETVEVLLEEGAHVNVQTEDCMSALMAASREGHEAIVAMLLDRGADVSLRWGSKNESALRMASEAGHAEIAEMLRVAGAVE